MLKFKIGTKFNVSELITNVDVDFVYNYDDVEGKYYMLNDQINGEVSKDIVEKQKHVNKIIIINSGDLTMKSYNVDEDSLLELMLEI